MANRIERDSARYREIIRGQVRKELKKYISHSEMLGRKGRNLVTIPIAQIDIPHFRFDPGGSEGVGQGDGEVGDVLGQGQPGDGNQGAGNQPGAHVLEVELTLEELAQLLGEVLELPNIEPRGKEHLFSEKERYTSIRRVGPESLRHFRRTYKHALKRQLALGAYDPRDPKVIPIREDKFYRSWQNKPEPQANAVLIYMMDVSGSMGREQKDVVRTEIFWIETWLRSQYRHLASRYIVHDVEAHEVEQDVFYHVHESGGTIISSAYHLASKIIEQDYPVENWNIYLFHFSDGDNWNDDNERACQAIAELLPKVNLFGYGEVRTYGGEQFIKVLSRYFDGAPDASYTNGKPRLITSLITRREGILDSIKEFLGGGV